MGVATASSLISEALLMAGDTSLSTRGLVWLNQWLRSQYAAWPWPFLQSRASGLVLTVGTGTYTYGAGSGTVTPLIRRIYDPVYVYTADKLSKGVCRFQQIHDGPVDNDEDARLTTQTGMPTRVKGKPSLTTLGAWQLVFDPIPERAYRISFDYLVQPADLTSGQTPIYPNDRTMVQAIKAMALEYLGDERAGEERQVLAAMTIDDRSKFGQTPGINDSWGLDKSTFR